MNNFQDIIRRHLLTEKTLKLQETLKTACFDVHPDANKIEIKAAVEELFGSQVEAVRTCVVRGKTKRFGRSQGKRSNWKKAYVKFKDELPSVLVGKEESESESE